MEKKTFETALNNSYGILNNSETISNQFYLVQDDGNTFDKNQELQNVTEIQEVKGVLDGSQTAIFDASPQQFYVYNVEPELLSINEQVPIPTVENNAYTVTYLIAEDETGSSTISQEMESKQIMEPVNMQESQTENVELLQGDKSDNNLTEITLSDEQYHVLEQKGWLLLEYNDKIFVLNSFGLHDITKNNKLIHVLRNGLQDAELDKKLRSEIHYSNEIANTINREDDQFEFVLIDSSQTKQENIKHEDVISNEDVDVEMNEPDERKPNQIEIPTQIKNEPIENIAHSKCDSIQIKTKYNFKDIPEKIFLGNTVNGKKLFAKVTRKKKSFEISPKIQQNIIKDSKENKNITMNLLKKKEIKQKSQAIPALDTARFVNVIQESFRASSQSDLKTEEVLQMASQVSQLMCLPNMRQSMEGANIFITKEVVSNESKVGQPILITGTVQTQDGKSRFVHLPDMLQKLLEEADDNNSESQGEITKLATDVVDLFHIHITEAQEANKTPQMSIHLSKRKFPLDVLEAAKKRHPNPIYACGACGLIFKSEHLLTNHQNNQCLEAEDELTIDTDEICDSNETLYSVTVEGKNKRYTCKICQAKFSRQFNCQKHIGTHKTSVLEKNKSIYKCKMCPGVYHHASTLSKHIMKMHLQKQK